MQTNVAGDNVHVIDPATNEIVAEITGVEVIHGVAAAPDGSRLYLSNESTHALDILRGVHNTFPAASTASASPTSRRPAS